MCGETQVLLANGFCQNIPPQGFVLTNQNECEDIPNICPDDRPHCVDLDPPSDLENRTAQIGDFFYICLPACDCDCPFESGECTVYCSNPNKAIEDKNCKMIF